MLIKNDNETSEKEHKEEEETHKRTNELGLFAKEIHNLKRTRKD